MGAVLSISDFRRAWATHTRPAPEPPPVFPPQLAAARLFTLSIYLALTPIRVWAAALSPWRF